MGRLIVTLLMLLSLINISSCADNSYVPHYPFELDAVGHAIEGEVDIEAEEGSKVHIYEIEGEKFTENGKELSHLQVKVRKGKTTGNELYVVVDTNAFIIGKDGYIIVNDTTNFTLHKPIEFYVVMFKDGDVVSNPVPFVIRVEKLEKAEEHRDNETTADYNETAATFAGVLICLIVVFALVIPFVVRAKRRSKHGKPIFKLGSHPANLNKSIEESDSQANNRKGFLAGRSQTEGDFYENRGFRLDEEVTREKDELSRDLLAIASRVEELDEASNVIQLRKKHSSDSDSGMSSDAKHEKGTGILKHSRNQDVYSVEMEDKDSSPKHKPKQTEESCHL